MLIKAPFLFKSKHEGIYWCGFCRKAFRRFKLSCPTLILIALPDFLRSPQSSWLTAGEKSIWGSPAGLPALSMAGLGRPRGYAWQIIYISLLIRILYQGTDFPAGSVCALREKGSASLIPCGITPTPWDAQGSPSPAQQDLAQYQFGSHQ